MHKLLVSIIFLLIGEIMADKSFEPEQVHLAYGESVLDMVVTWTTFSKTNESVVQFGIEKLNLEQKGQQRQLKVSKNIRFIHRVTLSQLKPNTQYIYRCGSNKGWSKNFHFKTPSNGNDWVLSFAIFGDMGVANPQLKGILKTDTELQMYDAIIHIGDIAYEIHQFNTADSFMKIIEPYAAYVPYMTCAGNHEHMGNFTHYKKRFNMPGGTDGLFYSFDLGPVHFIAVHTEFYYYFNKYYQARHVLYQYNWLERDLQEANKPENRAKRPWIILFGHRSMYCSVNNNNDCRPQFVSLLRKGIPLFVPYGLEDLMYQYGVDVAFWGHQHSYERMWPVYDNRTINGSLAEPYRNPGAPVHITTGAGGYTSYDKFTRNKPIAEWSALRIEKWSFSRVKVFNSSHLLLEQITPKNKTIDSIWIIKDKHGSYA